MNARKVYVARELHDEFVAGLAARVGALKVGDPTDSEVIIGPLITE